MRIDWASASLLRCHQHNGFFLGSLACLALTRKGPCWCRPRECVKTRGECTKVPRTAPKHNAGTSRSSGGPRWRFVHFPQKCVGLRSAFSKNLKKSATQPALSVRTLKKPRKPQDPLFPERFGCGRALRNCFVRVWIVLVIACKLSLFIKKVPWRQH